MTTTPQTNVTLADIAQRMRSLDDYVICGHVSPDGDCLGSQLALWHALRALGKRADCILVKDDPVPAALSFMPGIDAMVPACEYAGSPAVFVGVDVPTRERIGEDACAILDKCQTSFTIDHHAVETTMCENVYVDPDAASCSILVWEIAKLLVAEPPSACAECTYAGLVTDTGGFRYQNCDAQAFSAAADMVAYGARPDVVATHAFQSRTFPSLKLESLVLDRMSLLEDGAVAISYVTLDDMARLNAQKSDCEPLIEALRSLEGVRVACMLREQDGCVRGSFRAKDDTDVRSLAIELGGGGHRAAAGFTLHTTMSEARALLRDKLVELVRG